MTQLVRLIQQWSRRSLLVALPGTRLSTVLPQVCVSCTASDDLIQARLLDQRDVPNLDIRVASSAGFCTFCVPFFELMRDIGIVEDLDSLFPAGAPLDDAGLAFLALLKLLRDTASPHVHLV